MQTGQPSRTAFAAAAHRAIHQAVDGGSIFYDPLAIPLLGVEQETLLRRAQDQDDYQRRMRWFIAIRSRFAEEALAEAAGLGVQQLVVLGSGLDTSAYRERPPGIVQVFEVDHPATQAWKQQRLREAGVAIPRHVVFAPIDFETQTLREGLAAAGFEKSRSAFFSWLGVVPYLTLPAVWSTLAFIASCGRGSQVVFDYSEPASALEGQARAERDQRAGKVAALGEAWMTYFEPATLHSGLTDLGFDVEDLGLEKILKRYFPHRPATAERERRGGHILRARVR